MSERAADVARFLDFRRADLIPGRFGVDATLVGFVELIVSFSPSCWH